MNHDDWMKKYYPIPANEVKGTDLDRIDNCLNKWEGLKDVEPYGLRFTEGVLVDSDDDDVLYINGESCALCSAFYYHSWYDGLDEGDIVDDDYPDHPCTKCPLAKSLGRSCDNDDDTGEGVYFLALKNPQLMIDALKAARVMVEKEMNL